jgi:ubiquinone/menaquinone biosynthesis C-methylase UbiE
MTDFIREYWESQAKKHGASPEASWGDEFMIALEIDTVAGHLAAGQEVLDAGCANGHATFELFARHRLRKLVGIDYSGSMVAAAQAVKTARTLDDRIEFREGDIRSLPFPDASFDVVYTTRVLINLPSWEQQITGVTECLRVTRPGGKVLLLEAFWEPLMLLNAMRALRQLAPLVEHDFNRYLKKQRLDALLTSMGIPFHTEEFSSIYYLGSRFLRELVTDAAAYPGYSNPINRVFYDIERTYSGGGVGIQQAYILRKP